MRGYWYDNEQETKLFQFTEQMKLYKVYIAERTWLWIDLKNYSFSQMLFLNIVLLYMNDWAVTAKSSWMLNKHAIFQILPIFYRELIENIFLSNEVLINPMAIFLQNRQNAFMFIIVDEDFSGLCCHRATVWCL